MKRTIRDIRTVAALITPFTADGRINREALAAIVEHAIGLGVDGFYVCGSTGEGFQMSPAERREVVEASLAASAGRVSVVVNVSHMDFREMIALADHAVESGADAVSALPPIYNPVSQAELLAYFFELLERVRRPFMLYHIPMLTARPLDMASLTELAAHPRFVGLKYSSEDSALLSRFKQVGEGRLVVWSGRDAYLLSNLAMGADGAVGSSFTLMADLFNLIIELYRAGEVQEALKLQARVNEVHGRLGRFGPYQSYKACFELLGIPAGVCRRPFGALPEGADAFLRETLSLLDAVRQDYAEAGAAIGGRSAGADGRTNLIGTR